MVSQPENLCKVLYPHQLKAIEMMEHRENNQTVSVNGVEITRSIGVYADIPGYGKTLATGGFKNDDNGNNSGHVRIFSWDGTSWNQVGGDIYGEAANDLFGFSVSLSTNGDTIAIGGYGNDGNGTDSGHVRVFGWDGSSWNQLGSDIDGEAAGDHFGSEVSLSSDGTILAATGYLNDDAGTDAGHLRLFQWDASSWNQLGSDIDAEAEGDQAASVVLSSDATRLLFGSSWNDSNGHNSGNVRVYDTNINDIKGPIYLGYG